MKYSFFLTSVVGFIDWFNTQSWNHVFFPALETPSGFFVTVLVVGCLGVPHKLQRYPVISVTPPPFFIFQCTGLGLVPWGYFYLCLSNRSHGQPSTSHASTRTPLRRRKSPFFFFSKHFFHVSVYPWTPQTEIFGGKISTQKWWHLFRG